MLVPLWKCVTVRSLSRSVKVTSAVCHCNATQLRAGKNLLKIEGMLDGRVIFPRTVASSARGLSQLNPLVWCKRI